MHLFRLFLRLSAAASVVMLAACSSQLNYTNPSTPSAAEAKLAYEIHRTFNDYRVSQGLKPLPRHRGLEKLARGHCEYLRDNHGKFGIHGKNISHFGFDTRARAASNEYGFAKFGENVAAMNKKDQGQAYHLLILWLASEGHKENIHRDWTHSGVATCLSDDGMVLATQLFGSKEAP